MFELLLAVGGGALLISLLIVWLTIVGMNEMDKHNMGFVNRSLNNLALGEAEVTNTGEIEVIDEREA